MLCYNKFIINIKRFLSYYDTLKWYDRDIFDGIIEDRIATRFIDKDNHCNEYISI